MLFYLIQLFIILVYYILIHIIVAGTAKERYKQRKNMFISCCFLHLFLIEGFRTLDFGGDTDWYMYLYQGVQRIPITDIHNFNNYLIVKAELGYVVLNKMLSELCTHPQTIFAFVSLVYLSAVLKLIKAYSSAMFISVFIFFVMFWFQSFQALRQYLALGMCLFSLFFVFRRDFKSFLFLLCGAFFIHQTAIIFFPVYFLYNFNLSGKKKMLIYIWGTVLLFLCAQLLLRYSTLFFLGYDSYLDKEVTGFGNVKMFFLYLFFFVSYLMVVKERTKEENLFFNMFAFALSLQFIAHDFVLIQRLNLYYSISLLFIIPTIISRLHVNLIKNLFVVFVVCLFLYIMYLDFEKDRYSVVPYNSILLYSI